MGMAYLPDGSRMDYKEYIASHPHWQVVRRKRFEFDEGRCVICRKALSDLPYQTHHLSYDHLGNEHLRDVITLCDSCHTRFHNNWERAKFWKGREPGHWETFSLGYTAQICGMYFSQDKFICKDANAPNLCNKNTAREYVDRFFKEMYIEIPAPVDPNDLSLFVRNKRYEMFFDAEERGLTVDEFLDEAYGQKERGKNPLRQEAGKKNGTFDHDAKSMRRHYGENKNINILMKEAKKYYMEEIKNAETE